MSSTQAPWPRVNKTNPCAVCGKPDACKVSPDGAVGMCKRIEQGAFKQSKGWYFHRLIEKPAPGDGGNGQAQRLKAKPTKTYPDAQAAIDAAGKIVGGSFVAGWTYHNRDGAEVLRVIRYALPDSDKKYRPIHPAKDGWRISDPSGLLPLYRMNDLPVDGLVWVTEGEKAADAAARIGLAATTSAHGSGAAEKTDWTPLAGRQVCILPDADEAGRKYAQDVARLLVKLAPPARVKIVELPGLPEKGDVVEYIDERDSLESEAIASAIIALAEAVPFTDAADLIGGPVMTCMADVQAREIDWLWPGRVPLGRITLLVGRPGEGKSFLTTDMASRVTTGTPWPDGGECPAGSVLIVSAEDDPGDTIRPRLDAHHADVQRVHLLSGVRRVRDDGTAHEVMFTLADVHALEESLRRLPDVRLVIVDPIGSFLGGDTDAHRDNEVRGVLAPVARLAEQYGPAVVIVAHRRKSSGFSADDLALGSRAFTGIARAVWHLSRDSKNPRRRLLLPGKNNLAPEGTGLAFSIGGEPATIEWELEPVAMSADDGLAEENAGRDGPGRPADEIDDAESWLRVLLGDMAEHPVADVKDAVGGAGMSWRTVQRASSAIGVLKHRATFGGGYIWRLPKPGDSPPDDVPPLRATVPDDAKRNNIGTHGTLGVLAQKRGFSGGVRVTESLACQYSISGTVGANSDGSELFGWEDDGGNLSAWRGGR